MAEPDATKVLATRDFLPWYAPWASTNTMPADTVNWGSDWAAPYLALGYTTDGLHWSSELTRTDINVDQELDPVLRIATARNATMSFNLAEFTVQKIQFATGQGAITTVAPGAATRGHDDWDLLSTVTDVPVSLGWDIRHQDGMPLRVMGWKCIMTGSLAVDITPDALAPIACEAALLPDTSTTPARIAKWRDVSPQTGP